jgi:hypothetical protein
MKSEINNQVTAQEFELLLIKLSGLEEACKIYEKKVTRLDEDSKDLRVDLNCLERTMGDLLALSGNLVQILEKISKQLKNKIVIKKTPYKCPVCSCFCSAYNDICLNCHTNKTLRCKACDGEGIVWG